MNAAANFNIGGTPVPGIGRNSNQSNSMQMQQVGGTESEISPALEGRLNEPLNSLELQDAVASFLTSAF
jgi:hypothetical protein